MIDAASRAGANSIDGISFVLRQTSPARGQALADATQQAMNKARSIAEALGGRVLRVVEENESSTVSEPQVMAYESITRNYDLKARAPTPIAIFRKIFIGLLIGTPPACIRCDRSYEPAPAIH